MHFVCGKSRELGAGEPANGSEGPPFLEAYEGIVG